MIASISIHYTSSARTPTLTRGLPPSSSGPLLHGLGIGLIFREVQVPQRPEEMKIKLRKTETWQMWWISSFEETKSPNQDLLNLWTCLYLTYRFHYFVMLFRCDDCLKQKLNKKKLTRGFIFIFSRALCSFDSVVSDYNFAYVSNFV